MIETNYQMALSGICPVLASLNKDDGMAQDSPPPRNLYSVFKFGGSSVGTPSRLRSVISTIERLASETLMSRPSAWLWLYRPKAIQQIGWCDAADYATSGNLEAAEACVDRVAELAIANAVAVGGRGEVAAVRKFLEPLRKIIRGMSLLKEGTPVSLDFALSFGERLSAFMMTQILNARSIDAILVDARSWVETDENFGQAKVHFFKLMPPRKQIVAFVGEVPSSFAPVLWGKQARENDHTGQEWLRLHSNALSRGIASRESCDQY